MKMRFENFEFPSNPTVIKTQYSENIAEAPLFDKGSIVSDVSHNATVITCEGCFFEDSSKDAVSSLILLRDSKVCGALFLPNGSFFNAFISSVIFKEEAKKNSVAYKITFIENSNNRNGKYDFGFTYAQENENMFDIAFRCNKSIDKLMELNDFENPFSVSQGDKVNLQ